MSNFLLTILIAVSAGLAQASAQEILTLDIGGDMYSLDINTGEPNFIGNPGLSPHFWSAMAIDNQGRVFASYGRYFSAFEIYELNPNTGQATFVSQTPLFGISALAFDDNNQLFALNDRTAPASGSPMDFYQIDLQTGAATLVGDTGIRNSLAMDYFDGSFWTFNQYNGLHKIDPITGIATDVNPQFRGPFGSTISLCINDAGTIYYLDGVLWMIDKDTGTCSLVNIPSQSGLWAEAVFIEGPTPPKSLWLAGQTGGNAGIKATGLTPGGSVAFVWSEGPNSPTVIPAGFPCAGTEINLAPILRLAQIVTADAQGRAALGPFFLPAGAKQNVGIQAVDLSTCETTNRVIVWF